VYVPSIFGFVFLLWAIYALVRIHRLGSRVWLAIFWIFALATMFSHPINALILAVILIVRLISFLYTGSRRSALQAMRVPALSYPITCGAYLTFIAYISFDLFVRAIFAPSEAGVLATTGGTGVLERSTAYFVETAVAPLSIAIIFFFATFGAFSRGGMLQVEHRFLVLLGVVFLAVPGIEVGGGNFATQSTRFLIYMILPLALVGAQGVSSLRRHLRKSPRTTAGIASIFLVLAFVASSSYLTFNDVRDMYPGIPAIPTHVSASALASRAFLNMGNQDYPVFLDFGTFHWFGRTDRTRNPLPMPTPTLDLLNESDHKALVLLNEEFLAYGSIRIGGFYDLAQVQTLLADSQAWLIYDSGTVRVFVLP